MYIGIDHGTTAMRFAGDGCEFKISRKDATNFVYTDLEQLCPLEEIEGIAISYSMGDNFSSITPVSKLKEPGCGKPGGCG